MRCRVLTLGVVAGLIVFGCAKRSEDVAAAYISPLNYKKFNCRQLAEEAERVSERATELCGVRDDSKRTWDRVPPSRAVVVFWPTAFLVNGDDAQMAEYTRLKGEFEAILQVSVKKGCSTRFEATPNSIRAPN
jgi:hypothetical protein